MATTSFKCPSCGAAIAYVPGTDHTKCPYCQSTHTLEELIAKQKEEEAKVREILQSSMLNVVKLKVPLVVDIASGKTWFDC